MSEKLKYIGICEKDTTTLNDRLKRYKNLQGRNTPKRDSTNSRIAKLIKEHLTNGKAVRIFALNPKPSYDLVDLQVDFVKGLENPLVAKFKPEWNRQ